MPSRTLSELARLTGATLVGDGDRRIVGPAALDVAGPEEVSFYAHPRYEAALLATRAGAVFVRPGVRPPRPDVVLLQCDDPNAAFSAAIRLFAVPDPTPEPGLHPSAEVHPSAELGAAVSIGAGCVVGERARIGERAVLHPRVVVGAGAAIGAGCVLHPGTVLYPGVSLGRACIVHAGAVIGSDGFGFDPAADGWVKIPQCGSVVIEDEVEIGANCTIDRGRFGATRIGRGAKLDNLVHVAHNCDIGAGVLLCAQVGIAGSATVGDGSVLAGQAGVNGHIRIGAKARVGGGAGVFGDIPDGAEYVGFPARPRVEGLQAMAAGLRLPRLMERVRELEQRLRELENRER